MNKECSIEVLKFNHDAPIDFHQFLWEKGERISISFRTVQILMYGISSGLLIWFICALFLQPRDYIFIFLDSYAFWLFIIGLKIDLILAAWYTDRIRLSLTTPSMHCYQKLLWGFLSVRLPLSFLAFLEYWIIYYGGRVIVIKIVLSHVTFFLAVCDFAVRSYPLKLLHFYIFAVAFLLHVLFVFLYYHLGGTGVPGNKFASKYLNWKEPKTAFCTSFVGFVIGEAVYCLFCFLSMLKQRLRKKNEE